MIAWHGTSPGAPLIDGTDIVSGRKLQALWLSTSYDQAAYFQDGEMRAFEVTLENP